MCQSGIDAKLASTKGRWVRAHGVYAELDPLSRPRSQTLPEPAKRFDRRRNAAHENSKSLNLSADLARSLLRFAIGGRPRCDFDSRLKTLAMRAAQIGHHELIVQIDRTRGVLFEAAQLSLPDHEVRKRVEELAIAMGMYSGETASPDALG